MKTEQDKIIDRFAWLSEKHHKLSLLFYELHKSLGLDYDKLKKLSKSLSDVSLIDLKGGLK